MRPHPLLAVGLLAALALSAGGQPPPTKPLTAEQKEKLKERNQLALKSAELEKAGRLKEAVDTAMKSLAIERAVYGGPHPDVDASLARIGRLQVTLGGWKDARLAYQELVDLLTMALGKDDWQVTDARLALADVDLYEKLSPDDRSAVRKASSLNTDGLKLHRQEKYAAAKVQLKDARAIRNRILGAAHPDTLRGMNSLAELYRATGRAADAEPLLKDALAGCRRLADRTGNSSSRLAPAPE